MADIKMDFNGNVSIEKMFDIHDNQQVKVYNNSNKEDKKYPDLSQKKVTKIKKSEEAEEPAGIVKPKEIFHFVHPALEEEEGWRVHREVERLVKRFDVQEICMRLNQLKKEGKVLLPQNTKNAHEELIRMGMPTEKAGFEYKTFCKYYNKD